MSAFMLSKDHIDVIVQATIEHGLCRMEDADEYGEALLRLTYRSLAARYGDPVPDVIDYRFTGVEAPIDPAVALAAVRSYVYQSCETPDGVEVAEAHIMPTEHVLRADLAARGEPRAFDREYLGDPERGWCITDRTVAILREEVTP